MMSRVLGILAESNGLSGIAWLELTLQCVHRQTKLAVPLDPDISRSSCIQNKQTRFRECLPLRLPRYARTDLAAERNCVLVLFTA
jgi:hypothetical protein